MTDGRVVIETERLLLRAWRPDDAEAHNIMCGDPALILTLGGPPTMSESRDVVKRQNRLLETTGCCFWALELRDTGEFMGWCGLKPGLDGTPMAGEREIGWSLAKAYWRQGFAYEAATASLAWAWANLDIPSVAAITTPSNIRSWRLMEKLGMTRVPGGDFDHPDLPEGDPLRPHILYRIARPV